jgi:predicted nucleic acid-binding protein
MFYPDASAVVAIYVGEARSERVWAWLADKSHRLAVSGWLHVEFASALAAKQRSGAVSPERREAALADFRRQWVASAKMLLIPAGAYPRAAAMIAEAPGLRAGDALHLAIAEAHRATLFTLDRLQAKVGRDLGVATELL